MSRTSLFAVATLAALGLAAQSAAYAQSLTLSSGDAVTVSGAGTVGTIGGTPVANTTKSYSPGPYPYAVQALGTSTFTLGTGGTLTAGNNSFGLDAFGSGPVTVSGGTITVGINSFAMQAVGTGQFTITGGTFTTGYAGLGLYVQGSNPVTISGGTFNAGESIDDIGTGQVTITGGTFTAGPLGYGLQVQVNGTVDLFGTGFSYTVNNTTTTITSGKLPSNPNGITGTISGTLLDGEALNALTFFNSATLEVNVGTPPAAAPEPSQFAALAIGLLGLGVLALKAKKRQAA